MPQELHEEGYETPSTLSCEKVQEENMVEANVVFVHGYILVILNWGILLLQEVSVREILEFLICADCEMWKNYGSFRNGVFLRFSVQNDHLRLFCDLISDLFLLAFDNKYPPRAANNLLRILDEGFKWFHLKCCLFNFSTLSLSSVPYDFTEISPFQLSEWTLEWSKAVIGSKMNMTDFYNINWKQLPVFHLLACLENLHLTQLYTLIKGLSIYLYNLLFLEKVLLWAILNLLWLHLFINNLY